MNSKQPPKHLYQVIADDLRNLIMRGVIGPGEKLPNGAALVDKYGVARPTVKQAYQQLVDDRLAVYRGRSGYFVRPDRRRQWDLAVQGRYVDPWRTMADDRSGVWERVRVEFLTGRDTVRSRSLQDWFGWEIDEVVCRDMVCTIGSEPLVLATTYLPAEVADGTRLRRPEPLGTDVASFLQEQGQTFTAYADFTGSRVATDNETALLELKEAFDVAEVIRRLSFGEKRKVLAVERFVVDAAGAEFRHELNAV